MSNHSAQIKWTRQTPTFDYDEYNREHEWIFDNGVTLEASAAPEFMGKAGVDPEEALVASVSACHMLTFLAIASKKRYIVQAYSDSPVGRLEKNSEGKITITSITLSPKIDFSGEKIPSQEALQELHEKAHQNCFIANSILSEVTVNV